jgi:CheY-like chemotaxis protein
VARITPRRVLVVEDEDGMRRIAVRLLERDGHTCVAVATVDEALAALEERGGAFDLILTDVGLPGAAGWQLAHHAARAAPNVRVVIATGWAAAVTDQHLAAAGLTRAQVVAKPYTAADLRRAIEYLFPASPGAHEADAQAATAADDGPRERRPAAQAR